MYLCCIYTVGSLSEYKARISGPLSRSNEEGASESDRERGEEAAGLLRSRLGDQLLSSCCIYIYIYIYCGFIFVDLYLYVYSVHT